MTRIEARPHGLEVVRVDRNREHIALVYKFANMGMSGREISIALKIKANAIIDPNRVRNLTSKARRRGSLRQLTLDEKRDIAKTVTNPWVYTREVVRQDVEAILKGLEGLESSGQSLPTSRKDLEKFRTQREPIKIKREDGVKIGRVIIFPDGRTIPTTQGFKHTPQQKNRVSQSLLGIPKSEESVRKLSKVYEVVSPLCVRLPQISAVEWAQVTQLTKNPLTSQQVRKTLWEKKVDWHSLPKEFYSAENVLARMKRAKRFASRKAGQNERKAYSRHKREFEDRIKRKKMIAHFLENKFFGPDLKFWEQLKGLYKSSNRQLPEDPFDCLRLEIFFVSLGKLKAGDSGLFVEYEEAGKNIDPEWFTESLFLEEGFLKAKLLTDWADGEDQKGFFKNYGEERGLVRRMTIVKGASVHENFSQYIERLRLRLGNSQR